MRANVAVEGVIFSKTDYASFGVRLLGGAVDLLAPMIAWVLLYIAIDKLVLGGGSFSIWPMLVIGIVVWFFYAILLKYMGSHTLGYVLMKIKILNMSGNPPTIWALVLRSLLGWFSLANLVFDALWQCGDPQRQALRDKLVGIYIVKENAKPIGKGPVFYAPVFTMASYFLVAEVPFAKSIE